jgi:serine phosphatase RsbU (regulator of sigma subunit)
VGQERIVKGRRDGRTGAVSEGPHSTATLEPRAAAPGAGSLTSDGCALARQLEQLRRQQRELQEAIFEASGMQHRLCAPRELRSGRFEISSEIFPVRHLSGDFYDVLNLGAALVLAVGDIAGKGLAAGLWLAHLTGLVRRHGRTCADPAAAVAAINRDLRELHAEAPLTSLFLARLEQETGELRYSNAGQPPAVLLRRDGRAELLREGGPLLGALPDPEYAEGRTRMDPGEALIAYSDGIVERRGRGDREFGVERLLKRVQEIPVTDSRGMLFSLLAAVQDFAGGRPRHDDFTVMVARRLEEAGMSRGRALERPGREPARAAAAGI